MISNNPDFSSLLQVEGKLFGVTQFEAPSPGTAYLSQYEQNAKTGAITVGDLPSVASKDSWNPSINGCSSALQQRVAEARGAVRVVAGYESDAPAVRVLQRADMHLA
jgi:hypothetical protein